MFRRIWLFVFVLLIFSAAILVGCQSQNVLELTLVGERELSLEYGSSYEELGASASFGDKEIPVTVSGNVDTAVVGTYTIAYTTQHEDHIATAYRKIRVTDTQPPTITLTSVEGSYTLPGHKYVEEGFAAWDAYDGDLTQKVRRRFTKETVIYTVSDASGNICTVERPIVYNDPVPPELTLLQGDTITITAGDSFIDPGYEAIDNCDGDISTLVTISGSVNSLLPGTYTLKYTVSDGYQNTASAVRTVQVKPRPVPATVVPEGKVIYLTFDDGPGPYTQALLDVLKKYDVKATFFVVDTEYINVISRAAEEGHTVGIHTATHIFSQVYKSQEAYFQDLYAMRDIIYELTGQVPDILRFPGGSSNTISKFNPKIMTKLVSAVKEHGFQYFDWNVDSDDAGRAKTAEQVYDNVTSGIGNKDIAVVLMHDIKGYSVEAVERIILWGLANGYTFLPLQSDSPNCHHPVMN